jgi:Rha family phage regulatory protein
LSNIINIQNNDGQLVVTSRELSENFDKEHRSVLRTIDGLIAQFDSAQNCAQYFIPSEYKDGSGKANKEYLLTRDGFSLLVMGFTGAKALRWKVKYIEAFNSMEKRLRNPKEGNLKVVSLLHAEVGELIAATNQIETRVENLEQNMTVDYSQQLILQELAKTVAITAMGGKDKPAYMDSSIRSKVFSQVWRDYKEYFEVNSYKNTARIEFDKAKEYLKNWKAQGKILREIEISNGQIDFEGKVN